MKKIYIFYLCSLMLITATHTSCTRDNNNSGYEYMPDMVHSVPYNAYSPNPNFEDGKTLRKAVKGTIPRGNMPYTLKQGEKELAGKIYFNPLTFTNENSERGKEIYTIYCLMCHGVNGDGQGSLVRSKKYNYTVTSLIDDEIKEMPDGELFHSITMGYGLMGAHGSLIQPEDRWKLILYIRNNLQK